MFLEVKSFVRVSAPRLRDDEAEKCRFDRASRGLRFNVMEVTRVKLFDSIRLPLVSLFHRWFRLIHISLKEFVSFSLSLSLKETWIYLILKLNFRHAFSNFKSCEYIFSSNQITKENYLGDTKYIYIYIHKTSLYGRQEFGKLRGNELKWTLGNTRSWEELLTFNFSRVSFSSVMLIVGVRRFNIATKSLT